LWVVGGDISLQVVAYSSK